ncbi:hypothetical protein ABT063_08180 [Streptomyces sp. NPDC002838]|uniref:hypothetical protein n=1 Tax=Streptomyces sp. NPDC002838 TaxID=3154436 RepID=UPI00332D2637
MLGSKKIAVAAAAGVLGGFALMGVGGAQAFAVDGPGKCVEDGKGNVRCVKVSKYKLDKSGSAVLVNESTQTCPTSRSRVTCVDSVDISGAEF